MGSKSTIKKKKKTHRRHRADIHLLYDITDTLDKMILEVARLIKCISPKENTATLVAEFSISTKKPEEVEL